MFILIINKYKKIHSNDIFLFKNFNYFFIKSNKFFSKKLEIQN